MCNRKIAIVRFLFLLIPFPFFAAIHYLEYWLYVPIGFVLFVYWLGAAGILMDNKKVDNDC